MPTNALKPHRAVVLLTVHVNEVLPTGENAGKLVDKEELDKFGIKPKLVKSVTGFDQNDCLKKLKDILDEFD